MEHYIGHIFMGKAASIIRDQDHAVNEIQYNQIIYSPQLGRGRIFGRDIEKKEFILWMIMCSTMIRAHQQQRDVNT